MYSVRWALGTGHWAPGHGTNIILLLDTGHWYWALVLGTSDLDLQVGKKTVRESETKRLRDQLRDHTDMIIWKMENSLLRMVSRYISF